MAPTSVFLHEESHGQRNLPGYIVDGVAESGTTKHGHDQSLDAGYPGKKTYY